LHLPTPCYKQPSWCRRVTSSLVFLAALGFGLCDCSSYFAAGNTEADFGTIFASRAGLRTSCQHLARGTPFRLLTKKARFDGPHPAVDSKGFCGSFMSHVGGNVFGDTKTRATVNATGMEEMAGEEIVRRAIQEKFRRTFLDSMERNFDCPLLDFDGKEMKEDNSAAIRKFLKRVRTCLEPKLRSALEVLEAHRKDVIINQNKTIQKLCDICREAKISMDDGGDMEEDWGEMYARMQRAEFGVYEKALSKLRKTVDDTIEHRKLRTAELRLEGLTQSIRIKKKLLEDRRSVLNKPGFVERIQEKIREAEQTVEELSQSIKHLRKEVEALPELKRANAFEKMSDRLGVTDAKGKFVSLRHCYKVSRDILNKGCIQQQAGYSFEDYLMQNHLEELCLAAGVELKDVEECQGKMLDVDFNNYCVKNGKPNLQFVRNLLLMVPRHKRNNSMTIAVDGEIDAALLDVSKEPWQVLKLYEFKCRPADLPKAESQRHEIFRKLFASKGKLILREPGIRNNEFSYDQSFKNWFGEQNELDTETIVRASYKHFILVTQRFNLRSMTGLPSWVDNYAFRMSVTEDELLVRLYTMRLRALLRQKLSVDPRAVRKALRAHEADDSLVVIQPARDWIGAVQAEEHNGQESNDAASNVKEK